MKNILLALSVFLLICCNTKVKSKEEGSGIDIEIKSGQDWIDLTSAGDWRGYNQNELPSNWALEDGVLQCYGEAGDVGGDIISEDTFSDFEFEFEWKIGEGGNSGVFYHVVEDTIYHSPYQTGPEYQVLDDQGFPDPLEDWQMAGADYAMYPAREDKNLKPAGEWNSGKIRYQNGKVTHWLNGEIIVEFDRNSEDWKEKRNSGKWDDYPDYAMVTEGHLGLQDHGDGVWFRKLRVRRLE